MKTKGLERNPKPSHDSVYIPPHKMKPTIKPGDFYKHKKKGKDKGKTFLDEYENEEFRIKLMEMASEFSI